MATAVHLGPAAVDWLLVDALGQEACKRQSWDSSQALISLDESTSFIKVLGPAQPSCVALGWGLRTAAGRWRRLCVLCGYWGPTGSGVGGQERVECATTLMMRFQKLVGCMARGPALGLMHGMLSLRLVGVACVLLQGYLHGFLSSLCAVHLLKGLLHGRV